MQRLPAEIKKKILQKSMFYNLSKKSIKKNIFKKTRKSSIFKSSPTVQ